jgi:probable F420-dependent oxidoreductase
MSVRIGVVQGPISGQDGGADYFWRVAEATVRLGYDSFWLTDRLSGPSPVLEPMVALSMTAGRFPGLKFGTAVLALPLRNPVVLAKEMATLDYLSGGHFLPAVGLGGDDVAEYEATGVSKATRGRRADEAIQIMRRLWTEDAVSHEGEFFQFHNARILPRPRRPGGPPLWIGGRSRAAAERVGRLGDGWLASSVTPEEIRQGREVMFETAAMSKREIEDDHVGALVGFHIARNREDAAAAVQRYLARPRKDVPASEYVAFGTADDVGAMLSRYVEAGAAKFVVRPLAPPESASEQLQALAESVKRKIET